MKSRIFATLAALAIAGLVFAADVTGKWTGQVPGRDGQTREQTFTLKAEGEKLTGTVSSPMGDAPISDGVVKGDELSFSVKVSFNGNEMKMLYKGKLAGDEIQFKRNREGSERGQEFSAKRAK